MRITDTTVVQLVDQAAGALMIVDDSSGSEIVIPRDAWPVLQHAITYLTAVEHTGYPCDFEPYPVSGTHGGVIPRCRCGAVGGVVN